MNALTRIRRGSLWLILCTIATMLAACAGMSADKPQSIKVTLSGAQQNPPVTTSASGSGTFTVGPDMSISGSVTTTGVEGRVAHIHVGAMGTNGPVISPLTKTSDNVWSAPPGAKLTEAQYERYKAGDLYVNVHSAQHKGGEIRGQLKPR